MKIIVVSLQDRNKKGSLLKTKKDRKHAYRILKLLINGKI